MDIDSQQFNSIGQSATRLARQLEEHDWPIVFAESCTAGLVAASLARVPGISNWMCGSAVTYREEVKQAWLEISLADLQEFSAVSKVVTRQMALHVLERTLSARIAAAVTGHLGPNAPPGFDGLGFVVVATRKGDRITCEAVREFHMTHTARVARQFESAKLVLDYVADFLAQQPPANTEIPGDTT